MQTQKVHSRYIMKCKGCLAFYKWSFMHISKTNVLSLLQSKSIFLQITVVQIYFPQILICDTLL